MGTEPLGGSSWGRLLGTGSLALCWCLDLLLLGSLLRRQRRLLRPLSRPLLRRRSRGLNQPLVLRLGAVLFFAGQSPPGHLLTIPT